DNSFGSQCVNRIAIDLRRAGHAHIRLSSLVVVDEIDPPALLAVGEVEADEQVVHAADVDDLAVGCGRGPDRFSTRPGLRNDPLAAVPMRLPEFLAGITVEGADGFGLVVGGFGYDDAVGQHDWPGIARTELDAPNLLEGGELVGKGIAHGDAVARRPVPL